MTVNHVAIVIDESSSMYHLKSDVINVVNSWLDKMREENSQFDQTTRVSLYTFSSRVKTKFKNLDIDEVSRLTPSSYSPNGMTALFEAVHTAILDLDKAKQVKQSRRINISDEAFLTLVVTDGHENMSSSTSKKEVPRLIKEFQGKGNWTFAFLLPPDGKKHFHTAFSSIPLANIAEWETTREGLRKADQSTQEGITRYYSARSVGQTSVNSFYQTDMTYVMPSDVKRELTDISKSFAKHEVHVDTPLKEFVISCGHSYHKGCAFYLLNKKEKVQSYKKILIMEKGKKKVWGGQEARDLIGIPGSGDVYVIPGNHANYDIYVQSTSVNRKLLAGTSVLIRR